jgi:hypothetical protein
MWRVIRVEGSTVHLKLDEREPRPDGGPIVTPTPLADGHPDFEVMSEV